MQQLKNNIDKCVQNLDSKIDEISDYFLKLDNAKALKALKDLRALADKVIKAECQYDDVLALISL